MNQQTISNTTELVSYIAQLSVEFKVNAPVLSCTRRRKRSVYKRAKKEIAFAGDILTNRSKDPKYVATHEFAHHLDQMRQAEGTAASKFRKSHDAVFFKILLEVIDKAYSSRYEYPWRREYTCLQKWAWRYKESKLCAAERAV